MVNHHYDVPFRLLDKQYTFTANDGTPANSNANRIIHGDNSEALKSLPPEFEFQCVPGPWFRFAHFFLLKLIFNHQLWSTFFGGKVKLRNPKLHGLDMVDRLEIFAASIKKHICYC